MTGRKAKRKPQGKGTASGAKEEATAAPGFALTLDNWVDGEHCIETLTELDR